MKPRNTYLGLGVISAAMILIMFGIAMVPVAGHVDHACPEGEEYVPAHWGPWGPEQNGDCPFLAELFGTCHDYCVPGSGPGCGSGYKEVRQYRTWIPAGCVAVSCPAIPCDPGYACTGGACVLIQPAPAPQVSAFFPYTADPNAPGTCEGAIPEADIETHILEGRPLLISMESCGPNGCAFVDTFRVYSLYETGDPSCNSEATVRQYFTRCAMDSRSGTGSQVIQVNGGVQRIRVIGAKDETTYPAATQLRVTITEAYTGRLVWPITPQEAEQATTHGDETIYDHTLGLDTDLSGCRPNTAEAAGWIFGIPTQVT